MRRRIKSNRNMRRHRVNCRLQQTPADTAAAVRRIYEHHRNPCEAILHDGEIDKNDPEIILFEPTRNGGIKITGADYIVFVSEWEQKHKGELPPSIDGQFFHLFDAPNRFGLDPFYTLHVWAWKENPVGTFANWNPNVSCDGFNPPPTPPDR